MKLADSGWSHVSVKWKLLSRVSDCSLWVVAHQASLSMGFSKQGYWSGLPFSSSEDLPDLGVEAGVSCIAGRFFTVWATREAMNATITSFFFFPIQITHIIFNLQLQKSRVNDPHTEGLSSSSVSHSPLFKFLFSKCSTFECETTFTWI